MRQALLKSSLLLSLASMTLLSGCPPRVLPPNTSGVNGQSQENLSLKVRFELGNPLPDYVSQLKKVEIKLSVRGSNTTVNDSFDFAATSSTQQIERSLTKVPSGQLTAEVRLLDANGKELHSSLQTSFNLSSANKEALVVKLSSTPQLLPPLATSSNLASLRQAHRSALSEVQRLSARESELITQLSGLRASPLPEDQLLRQQYQAELQTVQTQLQTKETELEDLEGQLNTVQSQAIGGASSAEQAQVLLLTDQIEGINTEIDQLLSQRRLLTREASSLVNRGENSGRLSQLQGELQTLDQQVDDKINQLQILNLQLQELETRLSGQSSNPSSSPVSNEQRKAQLTADLAALQPRIDTLETEVADLKQRLEALAQATELQLVQRREGLEADLKLKQTELERAKSLKAEIEKQLSALN